MNAKQLLANYERVADAPNAVAQLRRFIFALAVRGKLCPQDFEDEPATLLLKRIRAAKGQSMQKPKRPHSKTPELLDSANFDLPMNWVLVRLEEIIHRHLGGGTPSKSNYSFWNGSVMWASVKDVGKSKYLDTTLDKITEEGLANSSSNLIPPGNLLVVTRMGLGKVSINRVPVAINQDLRALFLSKMVSIDYCYIYFLTHKFVGTGLTVKGIKVEELLSIPFPLPPLAEQDRIVAKVEELMALCDQLEAMRTTRERVRDRLTVASNSRLRVPNLQTLRSDARFAISAFADLTARPDQVREIRQTVLSLGARGLLVRQNSKDERSPLPPLKEFSAASGWNAEVFEQHRDALDLPPGWQIAPLAQLCDNIVDCPHTTPRWTSTGELCIRTNQLRPRFLDLSSPRFVSREEYTERIERLTPKPDDILYSREGGILGIACRIPKGVRLCMGQRLMLIRANAVISAEFLEIVLNSPFITDIAKLHTTGGAAPRVNMSTVRAYPIPVPPRAEQDRIVAKINDLTGLCDRLESALHGAEATRERFLEALLAESLSTLTVDDKREVNDAHPTRHLDSRIAADRA